MALPLTGVAILALITHLQPDAPRPRMGNPHRPVEIKDVMLPEDMKRPMPRQAEAERQRRARVITAEGERALLRKLKQND